MRDHIITVSQPGMTRVVPSPDAAHAAPRAPTRKHTFLGTAFLAEKAQKWGHRRLIALIIALFVVPLLAVGVLLAASAPFITYFFTASAHYQPTVLVMRGSFGAPGETDAQGIKHQTTLLLTYTDHLTLTEIPAGDAKRATTIDTSFVQHGSNPRIVSAALVRMGRKAPDLLVTVSMDWQSLTPDTFLYDFANHPEYLSTTPGTAGYTAAQFGLVSVMQGG